MLKKPIFSLVTIKFIRSKKQKVRILANAIENIFLKWI